MNITTVRLAACGIAAAACFASGVASAADGAANPPSCLAMAVPTVQGVPGNALDLDHGGAVVGPPTFSASCFFGVFRL